ncbi:MAG: RecX family transcriptional regulator [Clostridia bacterium]
MGIITSLTAQKNKRRVNVFIDNRFALGLEVETVYKESIKVGMEISETELENLQRESDYASAYERAITLASKKLYAEKELLNKLIEKGYAFALSKDIVTKLKEYNFLSDDNYVEVFSRAKSLDSSRMIEKKLYEKGVAQIVIDKVKKENEKLDESKAKRVAEKYMKNKENTFENRQKLFRYLCGKGYDNYIIKQVIGDGNCENWD